MKNKNVLTCKIQFLIISYLIVFCISFFVSFFFDYTALQYNLMSVFVVNRVFPEKGVEMEALDLKEMQ